MRPTPRTRRTLALALTLACGTIAHGLRAQERAAPRPAPEAKQPAKSIRDAKTRDAKAKERRERRRAVSLLLEVAGSVRELEYAYQRADILTLCADTLWEADEQSAHALFRHAWETATESDEEDLKIELAEGHHGDTPELFTRERDVVLTSAAKHDPRMGEMFLRELNEWLERHPSSAGEFEDEASRRIGPLNEFTEGGRRLMLASSLLDQESYKSAAAVAAPALAGGASGTLIEFLLHMRAHDADDADGLFLRLLERTRADARSDANDVLLLSSYVLAPRLLTVVDRQGSVQFRTLGEPGAHAPTDDDASARRARAAFFDTAAAILLRPAQLSEADAGNDAVAAYFAVGRLLPFFEREAPQHAAALRARLNALAAGIEAARRDALDSQMKTERLTSNNPTDPLRQWLDELEKANGPGARDDARYSAALEASKRKLWDRARRLAAEIENMELRDAARFIIGARQIASLSEAFADDEADDFEKVAAFTRQAELSPALTPALRSYGLARAAEMAARHGKRARVVSLLDEAIAYAQQTEKGTALRDAAALMIATVAARLDSPRSRETLAAAVAVLNEDEEFFGNVVQFMSGSVAVQYFPGEPEALNEAFRPFTVGTLFAVVVSKDFDRAVAEARELEDDLARAYALVAVARAALEKSSKVRAEGVR